MAGTEAGAGRLRVGQQLELGIHQRTGAPSLSRHRVQALQRNGEEDRIARGAFP